MQHMVLVGLTLLALVVLLGFVVLGAWQLERGREKTALVEASNQRADARALGVREMVGLLGTRTDSASDAELRFRRVRLDGQWAGDQSILLDNRTERGVAGYHVYTPLRLADGPVMLVNRGWRAWTPDRRIPHDTAIESKRVSIEGNLAVPRQDVLVLGSAGYDDAVQSFPLLVQRIELEKLQARVGRPIVPMLVLLDPNAADGYARNWQAFLGIPPERHHGYAVQWFLLATTVAVVYVILLIRHLRRQSPRGTSDVD
jgi:surfeit locus 1 family protein